MEISAEVRKTGSGKRGMVIIMVGFTNNILFISIVTQSVSTRNSLAWGFLILGVMGFVAEFLLPKHLEKKYRYIPLMIGISAWVMALQLWRELPIMRLLTPGLIIVYWLLILGSFLVWIRPMILPKKPVSLHEQTEAKTLTEIPPGEIGRVLYEGVSWAAYCENSGQAIAPNTKVYVSRRDGNTLIVIPKESLQLL